MASAAPAENLVRWCISRLVPESAEAQSLQAERYTAWGIPKWATSVCNDIHTIWCSRASAHFMAIVWRVWRAVRRSSRVGARRCLRCLEDEAAGGIIGSYLGQLAATMTLLLSPHRIVFGGGVMSGGALLPYIRRCTRDLLAGYLVHATLQGDLETFITEPTLEGRSGIRGAILLASTG